MSKHVPVVGDLDAVRRRAKEYADRLGIRNLIIATKPQGDGSPYVEIDDHYNFVIEERGLELERRRTKDLDELLYWFFDGITFTVSSSFELLHRKPHEDFRRQLFAKQEELLGYASSSWASRKAGEHQAILVKHPFQDATG